MKVHSIEKKIYYHDTDAGKVVYYANYLKYLEEARCELCAFNGISLSESAKEGVLFAVVHFEIDYKSPARYGDIIKVFARVEKTGFSSVHFIEEIKAGERLLAKSKTVWACINESMKPIPIPEKIKKALNQ
ncbi:MAG: YbgC/FadM family acyl-CoA thioesterase [Candidatus Omnitrophota bacterium]|nr:YbgC/FadM family acyl-CoA thioesterase [Candidatus Omnitrophota bacterium]